MADKPSTSWATIGSRVATYSKRVTLLMEHATLPLDQWADTPWRQSYLADIEHEREFITTRMLYLWTMKDGESLTLWRKRMGSPTPCTYADARTRSDQTP